MLILLSIMLELLVVTCYKVRNEKFKAEPPASCIFVHCSANSSNPVSRHRKNVEVGEGTRAKKV